MDIGRMINDDARDDHDGSAARRTSVKSLLNSPPSDAVEDDQLRSSSSDFAQQLANEMEHEDKPRRYREPPIWARKWVHREQAERSSERRNMNTNKEREVNREPQKHTVTTQTLTGIAPSISGIKPFESVTRTVTSWLHAFLQTMSADQLRTIELEAKIGTIQHKKMGSDRSRLDLPIMTEAVLNQQYVGAQCSFSSQLPESLLEQAKRILDSADPKFIKSTEHTIHRDEIYEGSQDKGNLRITKDDVTGRQVAKIRKKAISHIMIHCPSDPFDIRLSLSTEQPSNDSPQGVCRTRRKDRISYIYDGFRADLTKVSGSSVSSELEMECDTSRLVGYFTNREDPKHMDKVEELLQVLLDSMRYVNRRLA